MKLYCATTNHGKLAEFQLAGRQSGAVDIEVMPGLRNMPPCEETGQTFRDNAVQKALYYSAHVPGYLFVDDSGLAVDALNGAPGVHSARFAGAHADDRANNALLLEKMRGVTDRRARFVCVVALAQDGRLVETFEGTIEGELLDGPRGGGGFGYDPLFYCPPFGCTLAEATEEQKILVSHRGKALRAMFRYLETA